jgi:phenylacetate-CoA ligase
MHPRDDIRRIIDLTGALRGFRAASKRERWPRHQLARHQQERLKRLVRHAAAHSPYYRDRLAEHAGGPVELAALPTLDKGTLVERFDDLVCDRRLSATALSAHLEGLDRDALYLGEYRVMATSGSSGRRGLFVYDRPAWVGIMGQFLRGTVMAGLRPRIPRVRVAAVIGAAPTHMSRRVAATSNVGLHRVTALPVTAPLGELVASLNRIQPDFVSAYPSMAALLADEQLAGRLHIDPFGVSTSSELLTPEMAERIETAFGVRPANLFASTEGLWGCSCEHGTEIHLFEDMTIVENVDAEGRPVEPGQPGARVLLTNLFNLVQPLIRYELTDMLVVDPEPCACGRTLMRLKSVEGRSDDVLHLPGRHGVVAVHPMQFSVVTADADVREFQVVQCDDRLRLRVALRDAAMAGPVSERLEHRVSARLFELGVDDPKVIVEPCGALERANGGKLQMVVADRG